MINEISIFGRGNINFGRGNINFGQGNINFFVKEISILVTYAQHSFITDKIWRICSGAESPMFCFGGMEEDRLLQTSINNSFCTVIICIVCLKISFILDLA